MDIFISNFLLNNKLNLDYKTYNIIIDISKREFIRNIKFLFLNLLYPLYINKKNINVKNNLCINFQNISIDYTYMHIDINIIDMYLYLEAWYMLLKIIEKPNKLVKINKYILDNLNEYQLEAVKNINGPFRLLAPAGSGKTKTLINRILNLLNNGINPSNILALAFNKKAEIEMNERLKMYLVDDVEIRTFHSFGNKIIKENTNMEFNSDEIDLINEEILGYLGIKDFDKYLDFFTNIKNNILSKEDMLLNNISVFDIFKNYIKYLEQEGMYGYDDMIYLCLKIILENGKLRNYLQNKYKYILVDEAQDLNNAQLLLIRILSLPNNNIFMVGDDDQTIYTFRGANVEGLLNFDKYYPFYKEEVLKINYRSKSNIVNYSKRFIDNNINRIYKEIIPFQKQNGIIKLEICKNILEECEIVVKWIKNLLNNDNKYEDIAILYRHHEYESILMLRLISNNIPVNLKDNYLISVFEILINYLDYFFNSSKVNYKKILNTQKVYISDLELKKIKNNRLFLKYLKKNKKNLYFKFKLMKKFLKYNNIKFTRFIRYFKLNKYFNEIVFKNNKFLMNNLFTAFNMLDSIKEVYEIYRSNEKFFAESNTGIIFSTIHKTKGNEFNNVCYFHLTTPIDNIEDERKVSYVGFTRAKDNLLVTTIKDDNMKFVKEFFG